jgi:hypothetical protein
MQCADNHVVTVQQERALVVMIELYPIGRSAYATTISGVVLVLSPF